MLLSAEKRNSRSSIELDSDVRFNEEMTETLSLHEPSGRIIWCWVRQAIDDPARYVGTLPTDWIDQGDHRRVMQSLKLAAAGRKVAPCAYLLDASIYGGKAWRVVTEWHRLPTSEPLLLGVSRTNPALPKLTKAEQRLFRELATENENCNVRDRRIKSTARRSAESRLARKLKILPRQLGVFCAAYADMI
jgi:hypothetical protein